MTKLFVKCCLYQALLFNIAFAARPHLRSSAATPAGVTVQFHEANSTVNGTGKPPDLPVINETLDLEDFPEAPPIALAAPNESPVPEEERLSRGALTSDTTGLRLRRTIFAWTSRDVTVANRLGHYMFATSGLIWSLHAHTYFYDAESGKQLGVITKPIWTFHRIFELASYSPVCATQKPQEERGPSDSLLYPHARLTKHLFSLYDHWTLELYQCDGSLKESWDIRSRYWVSLLHHYDVREKAVSDKILGTIDQAYFFQMSPNYNAFVRKGEDETLFAAVASLVDIDHSFKQSGSGSGSGGRGGGGGGGGGAGR
eukprot:TRINITY_DN6641_c0_g1_i3.p1 TRINITY_DN6641_c0_g1~~TRINITY_DN6641_c0_g1_i3.p1  ORF type:complete len:314 (-),score=29.61 TRINITY_DN6641_c0_g1_i3:412-1353(-)